MNLFPWFAIAGFSVSIAWIVGMRKGDKGMPRHNCPARMGKVKMRNPHWRETPVITGYDPVTDLPIVRWDPVPVIRCKRKGSVRV